MTQDLRNMDLQSINSFSLSKGSCACNTDTTLVAPPTIQIPRCADIETCSRCIPDVGDLIFVCEYLETQRLISRCMPLRHYHSCRGASGCPQGWRWWLLQFQHSNRHLYIAVCTSSTCALREGLNKLRSQVCCCSSE